MAKQNYYNIQFNALREPRRWTCNGAKEGLLYEIASDKGDRIDAATGESARAIVILLNDLEAAAEFGRQCYQDRCEGALVEQTIADAAALHPAAPESGDPRGG